MNPSFTHRRVLSLQLQPDWHSTLRRLWQAVRQAADGNRGDLWLCGGMRHTEEHLSCLWSSSSLIYTLPFTVRSAAAIFIFFYLFFVVVIRGQSQNKRHEWAELTFWTTRCSIISFPFNSWSRFQLVWHLTVLFFFLFNQLDLHLNWISCYWILNTAGSRILPSVTTQTSRCSQKFQKCVNSPLENASFFQHRVKG